MLSRELRKHHLRLDIDTYDELPFIDAAALLGDDGSLNIFVLNRTA
jgi:hypothetical protein